MANKTKVQWCDSTVNPTGGCDASDAARAIVRVLNLLRICREGDNRVVLAQLPPGKNDPADCTREELMVAAADALGEQVRIPNQVLE